MHGLSKRFKNFFFPYFSERELVILFSIILLVIFNNYERILTSSFEEKLILFLGVILLVGFIVYSIISSKPIPSYDRKLIATPYFIILGVSAFIGLIGSFPLSAEEFLSQPIFNVINDGFLIVAFVRYGVMGFGAVAISKVNKDRWLAEQFSEEQTSLLGLSLFITICFIIFYLLRTYSIPSQIALTYFYTTTFSSLFSGR